MLTFRKGYFFISIALFIILIYIALYVRDQYIRPIGGDFLVVIFLYAFVRSFLDTSKVKTGIWILLFAYIVELAQYFKMVNLLGLSGNDTARVVIGTTFSWEDMIAYTVGVAVALILDSKTNPTNV